MNNNKKAGLAQSIFWDMVKNQKLPILLLILIIVSCLIIFHVTNQVHYQIFEKSRLEIEKDALDTEWHSLILEQNTLTSNRQIEHKAKDLGMEYISPKNEVLLKIEHD